MEHQGYAAPQPQRMQQPGQGRGLFDRIKGWFR
jgi:hypothetical protein